MIYFMVPDDNRPCGGIRHMYRMVDALNELGMEACIFHCRANRRCTWFANQTQMVVGRSLRLSPGDTLVMPEVNRVRAQRRVSDATVIVLNQNHFNTFGGAGVSTATPCAYPGWPNAGSVIVTSEQCRRFVEQTVAGAMPVFSVRCVVDTALFTPARKRRLISFMPRKRRNDVETVIQLLRRSSALEGWEFLPIEGMSEAEVAHVLGETAIFLSFSDREGFGLPPAEAMVAGCYVIGFTGDGGREFMTPDVCSPVEDPDLRGFVNEVERIAGEWHDGDGFMSEQRARARENISSRYNKARMRAAVEQVFTALTAEDAPAVQKSAVEVTHVSWLTPLERMRRVVRRHLLRRLGRISAD